MTKTCTKCQIEKETTEFAIDPRGKLGVRSDCKTCNCKSRCEYQKKNLEKVLIKNANWRRKNATHYKKWLESNAPRRRKLRKERYNTCGVFRKKTIKAVHAYRNNPDNKEKIRATQRRLRKIYSQNPMWRVLMNLRRRLVFVLHGQRKAEHTKKLIGCSLEDLKSHLAKKFYGGMSWENYGQWHIDHIIPCKSFDFSKAEDQKACFHYTNLQPLWAKDNLLKGDSV